jgi:SAM-dependent methyltransferase
MEGIKLNLGASKTRIPGFVNIDISDRADVSLDLGRDRLPFETNSVDLVFSYHTLEHVSDYLFALSEIHRVLKHGGSFLVGVPYLTLTKYNLVNPYHRHHFNEFSFDFFDPSLMKGSAGETDSILFQKVFYRFHYTRWFSDLPVPWQNWCRRHLLNVVRKIDFGLLAVKDPTRPPTASEPILVAEFDDCLARRVPVPRRAAG